MSAELPVERRLHLITDDEAQTISSYLLIPESDTFVRHGREIVVERQLRSILERISIHHMARLLEEKASRYK